MSDRKVIDVAHRFVTRATNEPFVHGNSAEVVDYDAAYWTPEKVRKVFGPSIKQLPFVTMTDGSPCANAASYWNDVPTNDSRADFKRGKEYGALTIEALAFDRCGPRYLEHIIEAIICDAVARKAKGGKYIAAPPYRRPLMASSMNCRASFARWLSDARNIGSAHGRRGRSLPPRVSPMTPRTGSPPERSAGFFLGGSC
jgi:hypothetical protein